MHLLLMAWSASVWAQCSNYAISMPDGDGDVEISWSLVDQDGVIWASGGAPYDAELCLPDGCYTLLMFDSGGDGWDGLDWDIEALDDNWSDHETLNNGGQDLEQLELGEGDCNNAADCPAGQAPYFIAVSPGAQPLQVSWSLSLNGVPISSGGGGGFDTLCLAPGCLVLTMQDSGGNGWQGAMLTISDDNGDPSICPHAGRGKHRYHHHQHSRRRLQRPGRRRTGRWWRGPGNRTRWRVQWCSAGWGLRHRGLRVRWIHLRHHPERIGQCQ
ncbi:MAG: hypothetical protein IPN62_04165 [Flavobacteriales bacterium]|nr:hypothetical protein [Flavobacteriales bacterium]